MRNMKKLLLAIVALVAIAAFACTKEDMSKTSVTIIVKSYLSGSSALKSATVNGAIGADELTASALTASEVTLESFLINIDEIEFELEDDFDNYGDDFDDEGDDDYNDEFEIKGPFVIDLLSDEAGNGLVMAAADLPNGQYEEIEVEFDKYYGDPANKLYGHTILIEGLIDGQEMKMWYDDDYDLEIDFPNTEQNFALTGSEISLYIDFYLSKMLDNLNAIDLSGLKDGNGNGIIEIGPDDTDGNNDYASHFVESLMMSFELDDDDDDDDNDDEDDD